MFRNLTAVAHELTFADVAEQAGLVHREQGRGLVRLDYDNDGDQDLVIFNNPELPTLVRNELDPGSDGSGHWLRVFLARADLAPDGIGSLVTVRAGDLRQVRYVGAAAGYLGPSELSAHFGLGARAAGAAGSIRQRVRSGLEDLRASARRARRVWTGT